MKPAELIMSESGLRTRLIDYLNKCLQADRESISKLFLSRVDCNVQLANMAYVREVDEVDDKFYELRIIGLLNGFLGEDNRILMEVDTDNNLINRFASYPITQIEIMDS